MITTEEEAKTKWCQMMASAPLERDETERYGNHQGVVSARCLGSACMAWRWWDAVEHSRAYYIENTRNRAPSELSGPIESRRGYCGVAGSP